MRGQIKKFEDIPDKFKCCSSASKAFMSIQNKPFPIDLNIVETGNNCLFCGYEIVTKWFRVPFGFIPVEIVDVDEAL